MRGFDRRRFIAGLTALAASPRTSGAAAAYSPGAGEYAQVLGGVALDFPRDHGAHPAFRTEWWYTTGWLERASGNALGFQITFFRYARARAARSASAFAPKQVLVAHATIAEPSFGRLRHAQRIARAGFGLADARAGQLAVWIDDWRLERRGEAFSARLASGEFGMEFSFRETEAPLLNGEAGLSAKGPRSEHASYYYSLPHLAVEGELRLGGRREPVRGTAWFDHEWSTSYLMPGAVGWDWIGVNLDGGAALMAFRIRAANDQTLWAGATLRAAGGETRVFKPGAVRFEPLRWWRSARTATRYPVAMRVHVGERIFEVVPLMDDQELDARRTVRTIYWEGAVRVEAEGEGARAGIGYLELTGYAAPLTF